MKRTHTCGALRASDSGKPAALNGWCASVRDHGGLVFINLRDRYGITQIVFDPKETPKLVNDAKSLRSEDVIAVKGTIRLRPESQTNLKMPTGEIELLVLELDILNRAKTPPFEII